MHYYFSWFYQLYEYQREIDLKKNFFSLVVATFPTNCEEKKVFVKKARKWKLYFSRFHVLHVIHGSVFVTLLSRKLFLIDERHCTYISMWREHDWHLNANISAERNQCINWWGWFRHKTVVSQICSVAKFWGKSVQFSVYYPTTGKLKRTGNRTRQLRKNIFIKLLSQNLMRIQEQKRNEKRNKLSVRTS